MVGVFVHAISPSQVKNLKNTYNGAVTKAVSLMPGYDDDFATVNFKAFLEELSLLCDMNVCKHCQVRCGDLMG